MKERLYSRILRKQNMLILTLRLKRSEDITYLLARELGSMALDYLSVRDETKEYDAEETVIIKRR